jgi:hypothetical protein
VQPLDHAQAQAALAIEHFRHPAALADVGLEVARGQALLLHAELDRLYRVSRTEVVVPVLVGFDQRDEHVTLVRLRSALFGLEDLFQPLESALQVIVVADRLDTHGKLVATDVEHHTVVAADARAGVMILDVLGRAPRFSGDM